MIKGPVFTGINRDTAKFNPGVGHNPAAGPRCAVHNTCRCAPADEGAPQQQGTPKAGSLTEATAPCGNAQ